MDKLKFQIEETQEKLIELAFTNFNDFRKFLTLTKHLETTEMTVNGDLVVTVHNVNGKTFTLFNKTIHNGGKVCHTAYFVRELVVFLEQKKKHA